jgi:hypothetical protein
MRFHEFSSDARSMRCRSLFYSNFKKPSSAQARFPERRRDGHVSDRIVPIEMIAI